MIAPRDPRRARVASIRRRIADGTYETPEKLSAALEAWLDQFEPQPSDDANSAGQAPNEKLRRQKPK